MRSFPFDSVLEGFDEMRLPIFDRPYDADDMAEPFKAFFTNGVFVCFDKQFTVTKGSDPNKLNVSGGWCHINGRLGWDENSTTVDIKGAGLNQRCDLVVLRLDKKQAARDISIQVIEGVPQPGYIRPTYYRDEMVYDLVIAEVHVDTTGAVQVIDTRYNSSMCGVVSPRFNIDLTEFDASMKKVLEEKTKELDEATQEAIKAMRDALSGTVAGTLQSQIDTINSDGWVTSNRIKDESVERSDLSQAAIGSLLGVGYGMLLIGKGTTDEAITIYLTEDKDVRLNIYTNSPTYAMALGKGYASGSPTTAWSLRK